MMPLPTIVARDIVPWSPSAAPIELPLNSLTLTWRSCSDDIDSTLWRECFTPEQQGLFWYRTLERSNLEDQFRFFYGLLWRDTTVVGIVPAFLFDVPMELVAPPVLMRLLRSIAVGPLRRLRYLRTFFIGNVAGEEGALGLRAPLRFEDVAALVHDAAQQKANELGAPMLTWKDLEADRLDALTPIARARRLFSMASYPGTSVAVDARGFHAFLATQKSSRRHQIKKKLRRGDEAVPVIIAEVRSPAEPELHELSALFQQTYDKARTHFERLDIQFFREIARCNEATFIVLRASATNRAVAFMLVFKLGTRVINQFIGLDYKAGKDHFLYFRLFTAAYNWAAAQGAEWMQSGQTGYRAKLDLGHELVPLWNCCRHRNPLVNYLLSKISTGISWRTLDPDLRNYLEAHPDADPRLNQHQQLRSTSRAKPPSHFATVRAPE